VEATEACVEGDGTNLRPYAALLGQAGQVLIVHQLTESRTQVPTMLDLGREEEMGPDPIEAGDCHPTYPGVEGECISVRSSASENGESSKVICSPRLDIEWSLSVVAVKS
jgi:hypothetical protein